MQVDLTLNLRTREVYKLFEREIAADRLFINEVLKKFNKMRTFYYTNEQQGLELIEKTEQNLIEMTHYFSGETQRFEQLLLKQKEYLPRNIEFKIQFHPKMLISNRLGMLLVEFLESYDQLVASIKLLHLMGCFISESDYFFNLRNIQSQVNRLLGNIITMPIRLQA